MESHLSFDLILPILGNWIKVYKWHQISKFCCFFFNLYNGIPNLNRVILNNFPDSCIHTHTHTHTHTHKSGKVYIYRLCVHTHTHTHTHTCLVAQLCLTLWGPMDCILPGSSVHGILQARILEWVAISFSRAFSLRRDRTQSSCITVRFFSI